MANNFFLLPSDKKRERINNLFMKTGIFPQIIEKDLWATAVLQIVFSLPFADKLVFKGGTSLSKVWNLIERFSEDIDLSVHRDMFGLEGDLTVRQLKKLRKQSSLFVKEIFCAELRGALETFGIGHLCSVEAQPDGEGDKTYPEPRKIFARYHSLFDNMSYLKSEIVLETGARALIEPTGKRKIKSMISEHFNIDTAFVDSEIITALPEKTFSEKAFLLHELFTGDRLMLANRKSRHLYDLEKMMDTEFAKRAIVDNELWSAIHHHRQIFTRVAGVDYSRDIRPKIRLVPPPQVIGDWRQDYEKMQNTMIYGDSLSFAKLIRRIEELQERFMQQNIK